MNITFSPATKKIILNALNKTVDPEGFIIDNMGKRVLDIEGNEIEFSEFAGVIKGSEKYIRNDFHSLVELSQLINNQNS
jgi:hypothetical protein